MHTATLAEHLEKERLEHRARRIEHVIRALEDRALYRHATGGSTPAPLRRAIDDFAIELRLIRRRLAELGAV